MNRTMTIIATVEANHTIQVPATLQVGERVMIVRMPSIEALLRDPERRARFAATRSAIDAAQVETSGSLLSNEEIVTLVKRARRSNRKS